MASYPPGLHTMSTSTATEARPAMALAARATGIRRSFDISAGEASPELFADNTRARLSGRPPIAPRANAARSKATEAESQASFGSRSVSSTSQKPRARVVMPPATTMSAPIRASERRTAISSRWLRRAARPVVAAARTSPEKSTIAAEMWNSRAIWNVDTR